MRQARPAIAGLLAGTGIAIVVVAFLIWGSEGFKPLPASFASGLLSMGAGAIASSTHLIIGWRLAARVPDNPIGWLLLLGGLTFAMVVPIGLLVGEAHEAFRRAPDLTLVLAWSQSSFGIPTLALLNLLAGMLFPDGRFVGPRWRIAAGVGFVAALLVGLSVALDPAGLVWYPTLPNPFAAPVTLTPLLTATRNVGVALALVASSLLVASLVVRYRTGDAVVRAQLRWIVYAVSIEVVLFTAFLMARYTVDVTNDLGELLVALGQAGSAALPIAAAIAITRYHLFGIDVLISRTIVYVLLMAILGGLSTAMVVLTQRLFVAFTGQSSDAPLVIAVFLVAAAFTPVRRALEGLVDRWTKGGAVPAPDEPRVRPLAVATGLAPPEPHPEAPSRGEADRGPLTASDDRALWETAAALIALRRFEERFGGASSTVHETEPATAPGSLAPPGPSRLAIDASGRVPCPRGTAVPVTACLGCQALVAILPGDRIVACTGTPQPV